MTNLFEELTTQAAMGVRYGLDNDRGQGLRGVTIIPAITAGIADRVGSLEVGKEADLALFRVDDLAHAGGLHDPVASLVFCTGRQNAETVLVGGRKVVAEGRLTGVQEATLAAEQNQRASQLLARGQERS